MKPASATLFILLFLDPPAPIIYSSRKVILPALGIVNVAPYARSRPRTPSVRDVGSGAGALWSKTDHASIETPPAAGTNDNPRVRQRKGVWMPSSQNEEKRRGKVFSVQEPQDLLDFVIEDERLSVVKVYASWCKTCKVFDIRYRKLASQLGDKFDAAQTEKGSQITRKGTVRFAEMQYDNPNNEEMCKLLNATKLPYILMYKGSKGKVKDFQCSPGNFQMLIDSVNELADPAIFQDGSVGNDTILEMQPETKTSAAVSGMDPLAFPESKGATTVSSVEQVDNGEDTIASLKQQLVSEENEKLEMFEVMKAQIEHDKEWIKKLETGVDTQRSMLEGKDEEISKLQSMVKITEEETNSLTNKLNQQQEQNKQLQEEVTTYQTTISQMTNRISEIESNITSIELQSSSSKRAALEIEKQLTEQMKELEDQKRLYEKERNSLRQLTLLGIKCVGGRLKSLIWKIRGKKIS